MTGCCWEMVSSHAVNFQNRIEWRKDLRSIPKVFLIDAYEVSWWAWADKVTPRRAAIRPYKVGPPFLRNLRIKRLNFNLTKFRLSRYF